MAMGAALAVQAFASLAAPAQGQLPRDTLRAVEVLRIGSVDGPDAFTTPGDLALLPDGSITVAFPRESAVALLDSLGREVRRFGGFGQGPGEIGQMAGFGVLGDTAWVVDNWRYTRWLLESGDAATDVPWRSGERRADLPRPKARMIDGTLIYLDRRSSQDRLPGGSATSVPLLALRTSEGRFDSLATVDLTGSTVVLKDPAMTGPNGVYGTAPFPTDDLWITHPSTNGLVIADRRTGVSDGSVRLRIVTSSGGEVTSVRLMVQGDPTVSSRERQMVIEDAAARLMTARSSSPSSEAQARRWAEQNLGPLEFRSPASELRGTSDGLIWLRVGGPALTPSIGVEAQPGQLWLVLDAFLRPLHWVRLPVGVGLLDARGSVIWGRAFGVLGVPQLVKLVLPT